MDDVDVSPGVAKIFGDEAAMTMVRFVFAAEEAGSLKLLSCEGLLDSAFSHEGGEARCVGIPVVGLLFVFVEHGFFGGERGEVAIVDATDGLSEIFQVRLLGKAG